MRRTNREVVTSILVELDDSAMGQQPRAYYENQAKRILESVDPIDLMRQYAFDQAKELQEEDHSGESRFHLFGAVWLLMLALNEADERTRKSLIEDAILGVGGHTNTILEAMHG